MERDQAVEHLRETCASDGASNDDLIAQWKVAQSRVRDPFIGNAGRPTISDLPGSTGPYLEELRKRWAEELEGCAFKVVDIDPLLAFQFTIVPGRCEKHLAGASKPPNFDEVLRICLPMDSPQEEIVATEGDNSYMLKAKTLNMQVFHYGHYVKMIDGKPFNFLGLHFGLASQFAHVVRYNGRCYLHNGYHRAYGLRKAGIERIPCVFRDVANESQVGIRRGKTFGVDILEGRNPPTMAHFTMGRAHEVQIRARCRVLHVSWAEYTLADE